MVRGKHDEQDDTPVRGGLLTVQPVYAPLCADHSPHTKKTERDAI